MAEEHPDRITSRDLAMLLDAARNAREEATRAREFAGRTRWRVRKEQLRARRLRRAAGPFRARALDDFVEVASVDELVEVLVLLAERDEDARSRHDRRLGG